MIARSGRSVLHGRDQARAHRRPWPPPSWPASSSSRASPSRNRAESSPITMRMAAPPPRSYRCPRGLATVSEPPRAATRSARPDCALEQRAAAAVVGDPDHHVPVGRATHSRIRVASACFTALVTASLITKYAVVATSSGNGPECTSISTVDRDRPDQPGQRCRQPVVQTARSQAVGDLSELGDGNAELGDALVEQPVDIDRAVTQVPLGQPDGHAERDQPLLSTVVQVALQSTALLVADLHQPGTTGLDLLECTGELQPQPNHLDQGGAAVRHLAQQLGGRIALGRDDEADLDTTEDDRHSRRSPGWVPGRCRRAPSTPAAGSPPATPGRAARHAVSPRAARAGPDRR